MRTPIVLYALALAVRAALILLFPDPAYADSSYYVEVARSLAAGRGFNVEFVWIFAEVGGTLPPDAILPIPSNGHWMPLASLVQVPFIWLFGPTAVASALPFAIVGALAAPLTWAIARDAGVRPFLAAAAGALVAVPAMSLVYMTQPDNFSLFQPLAAAALWLGARGLRGDRRAFVVAGLLVGLATLSRNDGVLVGAALAVAFGWDRWRSWRSRGGRVPAIPSWAAVACLALFLVVMAPWWLRQIETFGQLSPSTASGKVLFIRSMAEWNSITTPATLDHLLGQGLGALVASRVGGLAAAALIFTTLIGGVLLIPFMVVGAWRRRRSADVGPFLVYATLLFAFSTLVSAVHVPGGTFIHSAVALAPHAYILAVEGIAVAVGSIAARRPTWRPESATRVFVAGAVGYAVVVAAVGASVVHATWQAEHAERQAVARALDRAGAPITDRVMAIDAAGYRYHTGRGGVVLVNDPLETVEQVARAYRVRWLVVGREDGVPAADAVLDGRRPAWIGPAALELRDDADRLEVVLVPVCTEAGDGRCASVSEAAP